MHVKCGGVTSSYWRADHGMYTVVETCHEDTNGVQPVSRQSIITITMMAMASKVDEEEEEEARIVFQRPHLRKNLKDKIYLKSEMR